MFQTILKYFLLLNIILMSFYNSSEASEKVHITSDTLTINNSNKTITFDHDVILLFEDCKLTTTKLIVYYVDSATTGEILKIVMPNKLKVIKNYANETIVADNAEFDNNTKKLTLLGNVTMQRENYTLMTNKLVYLSMFKSIKHNNRNNAK